MPEARATSLDDEFLFAIRVERNLDSKTIRAYCSDLRDFKRHLGRLALADVSLSTLNDYVAALQARNLRASTIRRRIACLKVFYRWVQGTGRLTNSPAEKLRAQYRAERRLPRVLSLDEIESILREAQRETRSPQEGRMKRSFALKFRDRALVEILFSTGLRSEEAVRLNVADLNLNSQTLYVAGKGRRERLLYVSSSEVVEAVESWLRVRERLTPAGHALFINRYGARLGVQNVRIILRRLCDGARLSRRCTPHQLRHTMATLLVENGADVRSTQEILGHANIETTQIYLEVSRTRKQAVLEKFNPRNQIAVRSRRR